MDTVSILLLNTAWLEWGGTTLIAALVFIETGLLLGLVVPGGETLLFTAGLLTGTRSLEITLPALIVLLIVAAISGDMTGFWLGRRLIKRLREQPDNWIFKRRDLDDSNQFYQRHPRRALLIGRFLPVIRTFNPILAAQSGMRWSRFLGLTAIGSVAYVSLLTGIGFWLGQQFPQIGQYVEYIFMGVVGLVLSTLLIRRWRQSA
ncbi:DedA family protein [Fibrella sp. WM1]|uniref:DedA family protein n=1 Tax=Spirosoma sordidisoli TaxID=2502893 RepID=A0A4Q2UH19_9BACT|nr:DedA family protein [Spirosoma sordidisoli]RYC66735.1 DedA family protein [Spirosoma sordidisoli]